jgi:hypothetical protein
MHDGDIKSRGLLNGLIQSGRAEIFQEYTITKAFAVRMKLDALQNTLSVIIYENHTFVGYRPLRAEDYQYNYECNVKNVDVHILDTGI